MQAAICNLHVFFCLLHDACTRPVDYATSLSVFQRIKLGRGPS